MGLSRHFSYSTMVCLTAHQKHRPRTHHQALSGPPVLQGFIHSNKEQVLKVYYLPGIPEVFQRNFQIQIAHLVPENITLYGEGIFPRISLDLHRNLRGTPRGPTEMTLPMRPRGGGDENFQRSLVLFYVVPQLPGWRARVRFDSNCSHCKLRLQSILPAINSHQRQCGDISAKCVLCIPSATMSLPVSCPNNTFGYLHGGAGVWCPVKCQNLKI